MEFDKTIRVGMSREEAFTVKEEHSAAQVGSGAYQVLATPWLIAFMERAAHRLLAENLPEGRSSVGVRVEVQHLAPTPVGGVVRVSARITSVEGTRVDLAVSAWDGQEQVGTGTHRRVIVDDERFRRRIQEKGTGSG